MKLVYLYHSGFALLGEDYTVVIDYWEDSVSLSEGVLHDGILKRPGKFYVLSSHFHADHFNQDVLSWKEIRPDIIYVFSKDIWRRRRAVRETDAVWLKKGEVYEDDRVCIRAFGSTDSGVSFLLEVDGKKIFHAGDLNNWHWMDECEESEWKGYEKNYFHELDFIKQYTTQMDLVMFPVDPRLGKEYMRGPRQFIEKIKTSVFVPMHFDECYAEAAAFGAVAAKYGTLMLMPDVRGREFELNL